MSKRSDKIEYEKRVRAVQEWIINSYSYIDIVKQIVQTWGITERQAKNYIRDGYKRFREANEIDVEELKAASIERRKKLARELDPEYKKTPPGVIALLAVEKDIDKLRGLYVEKHELNFKGDPKIIIQPVQIAEGITINKLTSDEDGSTV